ncbi:MAG TPA: M3 family metallopeptidase [Bryobacteraceae bacterium]|nr:M3 family metallopeptidase [Bryobacteraceae bacterium]
MNQTNPLFDLNTPLPFDRIQAGDVEPGVRELLGRARAALEALGATSEPLSYRSVLERLDTMTEPLDCAFGIVKHLEAVSTTPELRAAHNAVEPEVSEFHSKIRLNGELWNTIKQYSGTNDAATLEGARRRFLTKTIDDFRRHGADLDPEGKGRLAEIDVELAKLTTKFAENVLDSTNEYELYIESEAGVAGLPPSALAAARQSAAQKQREGWRFTLQAPSITPVLMYLNDGGVREQMWRALSTRATAAPHDNGPLLARILELRREKSAVLGYKHFADYSTADRMAGTGERALEFLERLKARTEARFYVENEELTAFRRRLEGPAAPPLQPWDVAWYAEKLRAELYDFDQEALRPYFPLERVIAGMFEIVRRLYGVEVEEERGVPAWDAEVKYYVIREEGGGPVLGSFYADWFPRENKRGGAWMDAFVTGRVKDGHATPHVGAICGNLTPPLEGTPALLTHREVETIFHEFGHLLHHCLSKVEVRSLAGTNVAWDFVELPSQIMENWCWEREALDLFARHWQTGAPLPQDLFEKMRRARTFRAANAQMRQLGLGIVDLVLHMQYEPQRDGDVASFARGVMQAFAPAPLPLDYAMIAGFTHLFANPVGYAAGYYSYKWAEVLDADAFTRFRREGVFSREAGRAFRDNILARGDSDDPAALYRGFMGRDPDPEALIDRLGLLEPAAVDNGAE